ncbi:MAG TPA: FAD-dependent oxidoreductase [Burkholderiales bacterium]|nr:FAD-dependent oxidoreductase [Burkholderiales bacterium]
MTSPHVTVIGAGIVGVCSAAWLQRRGFGITLVDPEPVGHGASFGNAGNVSPGAVVPYTLPGVLKSLPGWLLDPEGPLAVRPSALFKVLPWLLAAAKQSTTENALATSRAMKALHGGTFEAYEALTRGTDAATLIERCGQLYVSEKLDAAQGSQLARAMREEAGVKVTPLTESQIRDIEPALAPIFRSGMLLPDNGRCKNPHQLVESIAGECRRNGAAIVRGAVSGFDTNGSRIKGIILDGTVRPVERVVIAAGAASGELAQQLGTRVPVTPERGYHVTIADPGIAPRIPVSHVDAKFVCAPMNMGLRLAGTAEFAGFGAPPNWKRAELLKKQARRMFPGVKLEQVTQWAGNRPSLPDGLPVLGRAPKYENAFFAFGNGHFGITGGPVMGKYLAEIVAERKPEIDLAPFSPTRFTAR